MMGIFIVCKTLLDRGRHVRCSSRQAWRAMSISASSSSSSIICSLNGVSKRVSQDRVLFASGINVAFLKGAKIGMLGPNGIGKSSLLKIIAGLDPNYEGKIDRAKDLTVSYLQQEPDLDLNLNVIDNIRRHLQVHFDVLAQFESVSAQFADPDADIDTLLEKQSSLQTYIDDHDLWNLDRRIMVAMAALNCPAPDAPVACLSGGEKRRIALCAMLLKDADFLLLDEPTNHLDAISVAWLEKYLSSYKGAVLAVTHDRYFLDNVATYIIEADTSTLHAHAGNYSHFLERQAQRIALMQRTASARDSQIAAELNWIRSGGRQIASKSRMTAFKELVDQAKLEAKVKNGFARGRLIIPFGRRLGDKVLQCVGISKAFEGRQLIGNLSLSIDPGSIIGVIGANGAGKSTLIRILVGELKPDSGTVTLGPTVQIGYVLQSRQELNPDNTVAQEIVPDFMPIRIGSMSMPARNYVAQFSFTGSDQEKRVSQLSGGERNRVHLAKLLRNGCNLLILDEPTNDLDVGTLRALEEGLNEFPGCAIIVSHDRWFLDRTCTHILAFEPDGNIRMFQGNYTEYLQAAKAKSALIEQAV